VVELAHAPPELEPAALSQLGVGLRPLEPAQPLDQLGFPGGQPAEVLVSHTVKDLVAGSGIHFESRGTHILKGIPGEWPLFAAIRPSACASATFSDFPAQAVRALS